MSFGSTSRYITLDGSVLSAESLNYDKQWRHSSLDLNNYIGNSNGAFSITETHFSQSAANIRLQGCVLVADLRQLNGQRNTVSFNLNLCVANINGNLQFQRPNDLLVSCGSCFSLDRTVLEGLCIGYDGISRYSTIDLNEYYENSNGDLVTGRHFYYSSRNVSIGKPAQGSLLLKAELKGNHWWSGDFWKQNEIDLSTCIVIRGGRFVFERHDGLFDRDGPIARFCEPIPFVGFVVAAIHACAGNQEHAKRALALCANSSIICCSVMIGAMIGGPLGGVLASGLSTPLAILVESQIAGTIKDPRLQSEFEEATIGRYIFETLRNMVGTGAGKYLGRFLNQQVEKITAEALGAIGSRFAGYATAKAGAKAAKALVKRLADAFKDSALPEEWFMTENKVKSL